MRVETCNTEWNEKKNFKFKKEFNYRNAIRRELRRKESNLHVSKVTKYSVNKLVAAVNKTRSDLWDTKKTFPLAVSNINRVTWWAIVH